MVDRLSPQTVYVASFNTLSKLIGYGIIFVAADYLIPGLYSSQGPVITTVIALTAVGSIADLTIVPRFGNLPSLLIGFLGMLAIIWISAQAWPNNNMTLGWGVLLTLVIAPLEYFLHTIVLRLIK
jgi:hypothetical protein